MDKFSALEMLESRIAPAVVIAPNGLSASYTDVDGDLVTVKVSKGTLAAGNFTLAASGVGEQLQEIDLSSGGFDGANLSVTVKKGFGGDGLAHVGWINSTGHDLGKVTTKGDIGSISAGDGDGSAPGIQALSVGSLGRFGEATQAAGGSLVSNIAGTIGALKVAGDVKGATFSVSDGIGSVTVGGSLIGGSDIESGSIQSGRDIGAVKIAGDLVGGQSFLTGAILSSGKIVSVTVGGSVIGTGAYSGAVQATGEIGAVKIGHNLLGGVGEKSGYIESLGFQIASVTIGGSIIGGDGAFSGAVVVEAPAGTIGAIGAIKVGGDVKGGAGEDSGSIRADKMGALTLGGSLLGGTAEGAGWIDSETTISAVKIGGSIIGGSADYTGYLSAVGVGSLKITQDVVGGEGRSGSISCDGFVGSASIGGSLIGGPGQFSGWASFGSVGAVKIGHDILGGSLLSDFGAASISIGGSIIGGEADRTGQLFIIGGDVGKVSVGGDLIGPSISGTESRLFSGFIRINGHVDSITLGGSIISGVDDSTGELTGCATIRVGEDIGSLTVKGSLIGQGDIGNGMAAVVITARGQSMQGDTTDLAFGKITIGGHVEYSRILAGFNSNMLAPPNGEAQNGDAQIGTVKVGGDWIASTLAAGVVNTPSGGIYFGNSGDASIGADSASIASRIASIVIGGIVAGTSEGPADHFGFSAQQIGSFKAGGYTAPLTPGSANNVIQLSPVTGDVTIREVA